MSPTPTLPASVSALLLTLNFTCAGPSNAQGNLAPSPVRLASAAAATTRAAGPTSAAAREEMFKTMLRKRPDYMNSPGKKLSMTIHEFHIAPPVRWTMEYGNSPAQDKNTLVYKVKARYTIRTENFNTVTGKQYPPSSKEYKRRFNYYVDRKCKWVAEMTGTTADWH